MEKRDIIYERKTWTRRIATITKALLNMVSDALDWRVSGSSPSALHV